jgi:hypothetical protein
MKGPSHGQARMVWSLEFLLGKALEELEHILQAYVG